MQFQLYFLICVVTIFKLSMALEMYNNNECNYNISSMIKCGCWLVHDKP